MKKLLFFLVFLVMISSTLAFTLDINESKLGSQRKLAGNLLLPADTHEKSAPIKVTINGNSKQKPLGDLINCTLGCTEESSNFYSYSGATATEIISPTFLTGIRLRKGSSISIDAEFKISNSDSTLPESPTIDVGNDGNLDWAFKGQASSPTTYNNNPFRGPVTIPSPEELNLDSLGTCQTIFLNTSDKFRINAHLKKTVTTPPSLGVFIRGFDTTIDSCNTITNSFSQVQCEISIPQPLDEGNHNVCLTAPSSGLVLGFNSTSETPQGQRCSSSSCSSTGFDYLIQAQSADFITTLQSEKTYLDSNVNPGELFKDAIGAYLQTCTFENDFCVIPIKIAAKNAANLKVSDLSFIETLSDGQTINRDKFLLGVQEEGLKSFYKTTSEIKIPLASLELLTPTQLGSYTLDVEYSLDTISIPIEVVPAPEAKAVISQTLAPTSFLLDFDATSSTSQDNSTLTYLWDFGDGITSTLGIATHSYTQAGLYTISLTVTDPNGISDVETQKIEIFSESATPELIDNTRNQLQTLKDRHLANAEVSSIFTTLGYDAQIDTFLARLNSQASLSEAEVNNMLNTIPTSILIQDRLTISPFLTSAEINQLYSHETQEYKATLQEFNSRFTREVTSLKVSLSFPTETQTFILVQKTITTPQPINDLSIIEAIPNTLASSQSSVSFLDSSPDITRLSEHLSARFSLSGLTDTFSFAYKVDSNNFNAVKNTILMIVPQDLSPSLTPFDCGNNICNPAEDSLSCPEDCSSSPASSSFPIGKFSIVTALIILIALGGWKFKLHKKLKLDNFLSSITSKFGKSPFSSGSELSKVRSYISQALERGHDKAQITKTLSEQGWSQSQISHAFKKLKKGK